MKKNLFILFALLLSFAFGYAGATDRRAEAATFILPLPTPTPAASPTPSPSPTPPAQVASSDGAPRIALAEAKKDFDDRTAVFVDTRGPESFKLEHVTGAINITAAEIATKAETLSKAKKIIAYCS